VPGLAQAAVHETEYKKLFDERFFESAETTPEVKPHTHSFTILARIIDDARLKDEEAKNYRGKSKFYYTIKTSGAIIRKYAELWTIREAEAEIQERLEELQWFVTMVFSVGGWSRDKPFKSNFYL
jgi:hypothetical protein